jgi:magnesium-transporting ATPase (P-type)
MFVVYYILLIGLSLHFVPIEKEMLLMAFYLFKEPSFWTMIVFGAVLPIVPDIIYSKMYEVFSWTPSQDDQ